MPINCVCKMSDVGGHERTLIGHNICMGGNCTSYIRSTAAVPDGGRVVVKGSHNN